MARRPIKEQQEATKIQVSKIKHAKISRRVHYEKHTPKEIQYKILHEEIQIWRIIPDHLMDRRVGINRRGNGREHEPWGW
jgi:hypothetical protein